MQQIVGDELWCSTAQLKWEEVTKKILNQASIEAHHKSRLRGVLDEAGKDGRRHSIIVDCRMFINYINFYS